MASWLQRRKAHRRLRDRVGLWFHPKYRVEELGETARVPGVEVARGEKILGALSAEGLLRPKQVRPAPLIPLADLAKVHSETYLERTTHPEYLGRIFGLEAHDIDVDPVLTAQRRQVGGTVEAAAWVIAADDRVGFNIGGGFHHAEPESGGGFCVYNDVAVAIAVLREKGFDQAIAIVDLDYHQGNGNIVTFEDDETVFTYSIHGSVWSHVEAAADEQFLAPSHVDDDGYLKMLRETLPGFLDRAEPRLMFYVSGNDILAEDRLGDFTLTRGGVLARDRFVVEQARERGCPVVVTLGGGYSDDAWRSSTDFIRWLLIDEAEVTEEPKKSLFELYTQIAQELDPYDLQRASGEFKLTEEDLYGDLTGPRSRSTRMLDYYSRHGLELAMEKYGVADAVRGLGFTDLNLEIDPTDPERQHLALRATKDDEEHLLVDQILCRVRRPAPEGLEPADDLSFLYIEWMLLQNPTETFSLRDPQWPGQDHPGLGIGEEIMLMLFQAAQRLELDGLMHHPSRYHIAFIGGGQFFFLNPEIQGRFEAIREVLGPLDLAEAAWKMERGEVCWGDGEAIEWIPEDLVAPASERFFAYLGSRNYQEPRAAALDAARARGIVLEPTRRM
jgi:acetoin utilization deacetylase AcuC-like enzyme